MPTIDEANAVVSRLRDYDAWAWVLGIGLIWADLILPVPQAAIIAALGIVYGAVVGGLVGSFALIGILFDLWIILLGGGNERMDDIDEIINEARDAREVKRAVSVKMSGQGFSPAQICQVLNVSLQYVSKWKGRYEAGGGAALRLGHRGSESYLQEEERHATVQWIKAQESVSVEARTRLRGRAVWGCVSVQTILLRVFGGGRDELPSD